MPIKVVLNIYSGRRNPSWVLDSMKEAEFVLRLDSLDLAPDQGVSEPTGPGYRGFIVKPETGSGLQGPVRINKGTVQYAGRKYIDRDRQLERWLLEAAGPELKEKQRTRILKELGEQ